MSAATCSDCGGTCIRAGGPFEHCLVCGWKGMLCPADYHITPELIRESNKRLKLVNAGKLFTIRITCDGEDEDIDLAQKKTDALLGIASIRATAGSFRAEVSTKPTRALILKLKKIKTVIDVNVYPGRNQP